MWIPDKRVVSTKETIGRRVFEENPFFERNGKKHVKLSIFYETRRGEEGMSFDRLYIKPPDLAETVNFLTPLARAEAAKRRPPRPFNGWMGIRVEAIKNLSIQPDPITEEPKNPYHALLPLERFREPVHADNLASRLALAAEDIGLIPPAEEIAEEIIDKRGGLWVMVATIWSYVPRLVHRALAKLVRNPDDE